MKDQVCDIIKVLMGTLLEQMDLVDSAPNAKGAIHEDGLYDTDNDGDEM